MRDPDGALEIDDGSVVRRLTRPLDGGHFLRSRLAQRWQAHGLMVPFRIEDDRTVIAERLPFITHPNEWSDAQLFAAGELTLRLQREAVAEGYDLKDAAASNVIYAGTRPVFCDLLSLVPLQSRRWWAAGQFSRHFVIPLLLSRKRGLRAHACFEVWRDGVPSEVARQMLGPERFLSRYWTLLAGVSEARATVATTGSPREVTRDQIASFRQRLDTSLDWMLKGVRPREASGASLWHRYEQQREHYAAAGLDQKRSLVSAWLTRLRPYWLADLGCNTGEFSRIALDAGACVVAVDADHDCVQQLFASRPDDGRLHPLVAALDDLSGGRGWEGVEHPGLPRRLAGRFDAVLMLALLHHLAIGHAIPLRRVAEFAGRLTKQWLIVEWIDADDPQLQALCAQRQRQPSDFTAGRQREAFLGAGFVVEEEHVLSGTARTLALLKRVAA